jgi:hypothetical protein
MKQTPTAAFLLLTKSLTRHQTRIVAGGEDVTLELEAEAKADLKVRLCSGTECSKSGIHNVASVKNYCVSEIYSKDHSCCDAAFGNRADIQDRAV